MARKSMGESAERPVAQLLQILVSEGFDNVRKRLSKNITLQEFLKMCEMLVKLTRDGPGQQKFWDMLEKVRQDALGTGSTGEPKRKKPATRKKKGSAK